MMQLSQYTAASDINQPSPPLPGCGHPTSSATAAVSSDEVVADIVSRLDSMESILVSDITSDTDQCRISLSNLPDAPEVAGTVFAGSRRRWSTR
jgi:hypothetical protein